METTTIRILVTGANGQLGQSLREKVKNETILEFLFVNKNELDITVSTQIEAYIDQFAPHFIINTAAYTQVDQAETQEQTAFTINHTGVALSLIHI